MSGDAKPSDRKTHGLVAVGLPVAQITRPVFGRRGFIHGALVMDWPAIVGPLLAAHTVPMGIQFPRGERTGGQLSIKVSSSAFATQLQHLSPLVIDKVNGYFGWKAVDRLRLRHGPLPRLDRRQGGAPKPKEPAAPLRSAALDRVEDPELRAALAGLAAGLAPDKSRA